MYVTLEEAVANSAIVVLGKLIGREERLESAGGPGLTARVVLYEVGVEKYLKDEGDARVKVLQFEEFIMAQPNGIVRRSGMPDCRYPLPEEGRIIVFLRHHTQITDAYFRVTVDNYIDISGGTAIVVGQGTDKMADVRGMSVDALISRIEASSK